MEPVDKAANRLTKVPPSVFSISDEKAAPEGKLEHNIADLMKEGLYDSAIFLCDFLITAKPEGSSYFLFGEVLMCAQEYFRAFHYFKKALEDTKYTSRRNPSNRPFKVYTEVDAKLQMAACLLHDRTNKDSAKEASRILQTIPRAQIPLSLLSKLAKAAVSQGKSSEAIEIYQRILVVNPKAIEAWMALIKLGVDVQALGMASLNSDSKGEYAFVGQVLEARSSLFKHNIKKASTALTALDDSFSECSHVLALRADEQLLEGNPEVAADLLTQAYMRDKMDVTYAPELALLLRKQEKQEILREMVFTAVSDLPERSATWVAAAMYADLKDDKVRALAFADKALVIDRSHPAANHARAIIQARNGAKEDAVKMYRRALAVDKNHWLSLQAVVDLHLELNQVKLALNFAKEALTINVRSVPALTLVGKVLASSSEGKERAVQVLAKALAIQPNYFPALKALCSLYCAAREYDKAQKLFAPRPDRAPTAATHTCLGLIAVEQGEVNKALDAFNAALALCPGFREALEGLEKLDGSLKQNSDVSESAQQEEDDLNDSGERSGDQWTMNAPG
jgi:tetratricopeptide (TPR) repeat protein